MRIALPNAVINNRKLRSEKVLLKPISAIATVVLTNMFLCDEISALYTALGSIAVSSFIYHILRKYLDNKALCII